ncbi:hypothetical protein Tco_0102727 [Tanacetum coccineum]
MSSDTKLTKDEECESVDSTKYRGMIGSKTSSLEAVKCIFRYIKAQHKPELRPTKDFEAKYNKAKTKLALLSLSASASKASILKNKGLIAEAYEWDEEPTLLHYTTLLHDLITTTQLLHTLVFFTPLLHQATTIITPN